MGTDRPQVTIRAATLAGGARNQDRYAYGDGWAFVLDGASSFDSHDPDHDGGWYAERLKNALTNELTSFPSRSVTTLVGRAIKSAASAHHEPETCPTSTIALARWNDHHFELYVLGDSTAAVVTAEEEIVLKDSRIANVGTDLRSHYRAQLRSGGGFDERHRETLHQLQQRQAAVRNSRGEFWIAGSDPAAADNAFSIHTGWDNLRVVVLATDGAETALRYRLANSWAEFALATLPDLLTKSHSIESSDPKASKWPRSKLHDDKTAITIEVV